MDLFYEQFLNFKKHYFFNKYSSIHRKEQIYSTFFLYEQLQI